MQGYAAKMRASNGNRLETFTRVHCVYSIRTCPMQVLGLEQQVEKGGQEGDLDQTSRDAMAIRFSFELAVKKEDHIDGIA